jgi:hypothetical protein
MNKKKKTTRKYKKTLFNRALKKQKNNEYNQVSAYKKKFKHKNYHFQKRNTDFAMYLIVKK